MVSHLCIRENGMSFSLCCMMVSRFIGFSVNDTTSFFFKFNLCVCCFCMCGVSLWAYAHHRHVEDRVRCCVFCIAPHLFALGWTATEPEAHSEDLPVLVLGLQALKSMSSCAGGSRTGPGALRGSHLSSLPLLVVVRISHFPTHYFFMYI